MLLSFNVRCAALLLMASTIVSPASFAQDVETIGRINAIRSSMTLERNEERLPATRQTLLQRRDQLETDDTGRAFLQFIDRTSLQLAPNSSVTLNEDFLRKRSGDATDLSVKRGTLRVIGGKSSKPSEDADQSPEEQGLRIQTPNALVVVRGGMVDMEISADQSAVLLRYGRLECEGVERLVVTTPGHGCLMTRAAGEARQWALDFLQAQLDALPELNSKAQDQPIYEPLPCGFRDGLEAPGCVQTETLD